MGVKAWHSTMGGSPIKKISLHEGSLHKDIVKDSFWTTVLTQNIALIGLWLFWLKDPFDIRLTEWYLTCSRYVVSATCILAAFGVIVAAALVAILFREKSWSIEDIAAALDEPVMARVYDDLWLWVPCNMLIFVRLAADINQMVDFWHWFVGDIAYILVIWCWAFADNSHGFDESLDFKHVFVNLKKVQVPSAGSAVDVREGLSVEINKKDLILDLRKCRVTVYGKGTLLIKWHKPKSLCLLKLGYYNCLKVTHLNGDVTKYRYDGNVWRKEVAFRK